MEEKCGICNGERENPYRHIVNGTIRYGCISDFHDGALPEGTDTYRWHMRGKNNLQTYDDTVIVPNVLIRTPHDGVYVKLTEIDNPDTISMNLLPDIPVCRIDGEGDVDIPFI